jgi:hypothetical protein
VPVLSLLPRWLADRADRRGVEVRPMNPHESEARRIVETVYAGHDRIIDKGDLIEAVAAALAAAEDKGREQCLVVIDKHAKTIATHYEAAGMKELGKIRIETCVSLDAAIRVLKRPAPSAPAATRKKETCEHFLHETTIPAKVCNKCGVAMVTVPFATVVDPTSGTPVSGSIRCAAPAKESPDAGTQEGKS